MATIISMPTKPAIIIHINYECKREGSDMLYRFTVSADPPPENSRFAYNLKFDLQCNGSSLLSGGTIKGVSPASWSEPITKIFPSASDWYRVSNISSSNSVIAGYKLYSTQTDGESSYTEALTVLPETGFPVYVKTEGAWQIVKKIYIKVGGVWKTAKKVYLKSGGEWKET